MLSEKRWNQMGWGLLLALLALLMLGALLYDRVGWELESEARLVPGEATYLLQAASLGYDFDLAYTRADFDRFHGRSMAEPLDLELASGSSGRRITYDRPFPYALYLAPFARLWPGHSWPGNGFAVANVLLLALASLFAARVLAVDLGGAAPLLVAALVFASVSFEYVFLATGDLFLMAVTVVAWGLLAVVRRPPPRLTAARRGFFDGGLSPVATRRVWLAVGALLSVPFLTEPLYGVLLVAAFFAIPAVEEKATLRTTFLLGATLAVLVQIVVQWWASGGLHLFATERFYFTRATGFPLVDFTAEEWSEMVRRFSALHWEGAPRLAWGMDPLLWLWDAVYFLLGRNVGLLPYFAPLGLVLAGASWRAHRKALLWGAVVFSLGLIVLRPFHFFGGEGAVANRIFLPVYGALWFLLDRRPRLAAVVPALVVATLFMGNLWASPWAPPIDPHGGYRHVTPLADELLPYESTQRPIPPQIHADLGELRLHFLSDAVWAEEQRDQLRLEPGRRARFMVASPRKLQALRLEFSAGAPGEIQVHGLRRGETLLAADGGVVFQLRPGLLTRHHPMWWTPDRQWLYMVDFEFEKEAEAALAFRVIGE